MYTNRISSRSYPEFNSALKKTNNNVSTSALFRKIVESKRTLKLGPNGKLFAVQMSSAKRTLTFDRRRCRTFGATLHVLLIKGHRLPRPDAFACRHTYIHVYVTYPFVRCKISLLTVAEICERMTKLLFPIAFNRTSFNSTRQSRVIGSYDEISENSYSPSRKATFANLHASLKLSIQQFINVINVNLGLGTLLQSRNLGIHRNISHLPIKM